MEDKVSTLFKTLEEALLASKKRPWNLFQNLEPAYCALSTYKGALEESEKEMSKITVEEEATRYLEAILNNYEGYQQGLEERQAAFAKKLGEEEFWFLDLEQQFAFDDEERDWKASYYQKHANYVRLI